jgi:hypothetical protein
VFLREILEDLLHYPSAEHRYVLDKGVAAKPKVTDGVLRLIEKVISGIDEGRVPEPFDFVPDWILHPLLLLRQLKPLEERCTRCYEASCALLRGAAATPHAHAYSEAYSHLLEDIARGIDYKSAHRECLVALVR